jgi:predicted transposase/invertase (TIGR01784 family)
MSFVNSLLEQVHLPKAVELTISNPFQVSRFIDQKESELDILYRDESKREVQLEMQIVAHAGLAQRMLHNWTQLYQRQLTIGQKYLMHLPGISVWILDDCMFNDGNWLHIFHCRDKETGCILHEDLCIITVELPVWQKLSKDGNESILDSLGKWLYFLTHSKGAEKDVLLDTLKEPMFEEAVDVITEFSKEQKLRHAYDMRENHERIVQSYIHTGFLDGLEQGKQDGFQDGIQKERRDMARKMKAAGLQMEQIVELTGLDAGEVDSL